MPDQSNGERRQLYDVHASSAGTFIAPGGNDSEYGSYEHLQQHQNRFFQRLVVLVSEYRYQYRIKFEVSIGFGVGQKRYRYCPKHCSLGGLFNLTLT